MKAVSPETLPATIAGALKMPTPMTMPTIIATASNTVSVGRGCPPALLLRLPAALIAAPPAIDGGRSGAQVRLRRAASAAPATAPRAGRRLRRS